MIDTEIAKQRFQAAANVEFLTRIATELEPLTQQTDADFVAEIQVAIRRLLTAASIARRKLE